MLLLVFRLGADRYGLEVTQVLEVAPLVTLKTVPQAPGYVAGLMNYRGHPVPVLDLCHLGGGGPCNLNMSTRIVLLHYSGTDGTRHVLGIMAENVTETIKCAPDNFERCGIRVSDAPYLGAVSAKGDGMIQLIEADRLLSDEVRSLIFQDDEPALDATHAQ